MKNGVVSEEQVIATVIQTYVETALLAITAFDFLLCFSDEITFIWTPPPKLSTFIYIVVRYLPAAKIIFIIIIEDKDKMPPQILSFHCTTIYHFVEFLGVISRAGIMGTCTLFARTYAFYNSSLKYPLMLLAMLSVIAVILGFVRGPLVSVVRLAAEALGIGIVMYHGHSYLKIDAQFLGTQPLSSFIVKSVNYHPQPHLVNPYLTGILNALPLPIPALLISRFLLDLRRIETEKSHLSETTLSFASSRFEESVCCNPITHIRDVLKNLLALPDI
ncbi:hypothetical protein Clacol_004508 [Clathrus columnatus]|uniref:DUF6533 domain-containing protein n=1 Tax=Clathrus columnatus TaxID=1419009 RepID=A0AAV5A9B0_9AGAM|nr:hypothetical protein Clacol_004508 [Clathrus columnatus]